MGFTLLEVVVALVLMAAVSLAAGLALRLAVEANERVEAEGDSRQVMAVLPEMLARQLALVRVGSKFSPVQSSAEAASAIAKDVGAGLDADSSLSELAFCGDEHRLSFVTVHSRQGSAYQGVLWVSYVYDEADRSLSIYQKIITRIEDLGGKEKGPGLLRSKRKRVTFEPERVSRIEDVSAFRLSYSEEPDADPSDSSAWLPTWECDAKFGEIDFGPPAQVSLTLEVGVGKGKRSGTWIFPVGNMGSFGPNAPSGGVPAETGAPAEKGAAAPS